MALINNLDDRYFFIFRSADLKIRIIIILPIDQPKIILPTVCTTKN